MVISSPSTLAQTWLCSTRRSTSSRIADDLIVKRLERRLDGGLIVHSDNARYAPETLARNQLDTLHILGRVLLVTTPPR